MIVRPMTESDIPVLVEIGSQAHAESEYNIMSFSPDKCAALCRNLIENESLMCVVVVKDDAIIGVFAASAGETYFSTDRTASDILVYVIPEYRGSHAFLMLYAEYKEWAIKQGVKIMFLRNTTGYEPEKVGFLYHKLGFTQVGGIFRMEVNNV